MALNRLINKFKDGRILDINISNKNKLKKERKKRKKNYGGNVWKRDERNHQKKIITSGMLKARKEKNSLL